MASGLVGTNGKGVRPSLAKPRTLSTVGFLNARQGDTCLQSLLWRPYTTSVAKPQPPEYKDDYRAQDVFADKYFYGGNEAAAALYAPKREAVFGQMPLHEAASKWNTPEKQAELALETGVHSPFLISFMRRSPIEHRLREEILAVNEGKELDLIKDRHVNIHSINKQMDYLHEAQLDNRAKQIIYVMGPSGSGKTFFSVKQAATQSLPLSYQGHFLTLYVKPSKLKLEKHEKLDDAVMRAIRNTLSNKHKDYDRKLPLKMHVSLVLDEIVKNDFFEQENALNSFFESHLKTLAASVRLVVTGTGITGKHLVTDVDCVKVHLKKWTRTEVKAILEAHAPSQPESILNAISSQPMLDALATNARTAWHLLREIMDLTLGDRTEHEIFNRVNNATRYFVGALVRCYINLNALHRLTPVQRRRVAAFVLGAVADARDAPSLDDPDLRGLSDEEAAVAWSLIDHNVAYSRNSPPVLIERDARAISVSPAITLVLFTMLGVTAEVFTTWRVQQRISVLYLFRVRVLGCLDRYRAARKKCNLDEEGPDLDPRGRRAWNEKFFREMDRDLSSIQLCSAYAPVPPTRFNDIIKIPRFDKDALWMNGERAPFADVIAKFILIRCKHCTSSHEVTLDLLGELWKCGLLKKNKQDDRGRLTLRGLWAVWTGNFGDHKPRTYLSVDETVEEDLNVEDQETVFWSDANHSVGGESAKHQRTLSVKQRSCAFPENLLDSPNFLLQVPLLEIIQEEKNWVIKDGNRSKHLPELAHFSRPDPSQPQIMFVISTNATSIKLDDTLTITKEDLDSDGSIDESTVCPAKTRWLDLLKQNVVLGVNVKFLLT
jgi:hypothetical protein